mgnify:FL=1
MATAIRATAEPRFAVHIHTFLPVLGVMIAQDRGGGFIRKTGKGDNAASGFKRSRRFTGFNGVTMLGNDHLPNRD